MNADLIALGLSPFAPERAAVAAGRVMLARLRDLARRRETFAFETTLSGCGHARWICGLTESGYLIHVIFLWLPRSEHAIARVADRVRRGGQPVPDAFVRRRYPEGLNKFFQPYRPMATTWQLHDNATGGLPRLVAHGGKGDETRVLYPDSWRRARRGNEDARHGSSG